MSISAGQGDALPPPPAPVDGVVSDSLVKRMLTAIAAAIIAAAIAYVLLHSVDGRLFSTADAGSQANTLVSTTTAARMPPWGLYLRELTDAEREERNVKSGILVIVAVGASAIAGVKADDVITKVDDKVVRNVDEFWNLAAATNGRFALTVRRKDEELVIKIGSAEGEVVAALPHAVGSRS